MMSRNSLLLVGTVAALLCAGSAKAAGSFSMGFAGQSGTGATGTMAFDFTNVMDNEYIMKIDITNTTGTAPSPGTATSSQLTAFAISFPESFTSSSSNFGYNPLSSPFIFLDPSASIGSVGSFDVCATSKANGQGVGNCNGAGSGNAGLPSSPPPINTTSVQFTINSTAGSADAVSQAFQAFINSSTPDPAVAMRWQAIVGSTVSTSDKGGGKIICTPGTPGCTGGGSGDEVPGPLPLFGAAAAFGYSRKLRRRINATSVVS